MRRSPLLLLLVLLAGCGEKREPAPKPAATPAATKAPATGRFVRMSFQGISVLRPADWTGTKDEIGFIYGPKADDGGAMGFFVREDPQSAADWIRRIVLSDKRVKVLMRRKVKVPGIGTGIRITTQVKPQDPQDEIYASSIDGLLVEVTIDGGKHLSEREEEKILSSLRRDG